LETVVANNVLLEHTLMQLMENIRCDEQREDRLGDPQVLAKLIGSYHATGIVIFFTTSDNALLGVVG
jgi:hypothetical protein